MARLIKIILFYGSGGLAFLLGAAIMVSWHAGSPALIQLRPGMVPMQYNTALAHMLCALGLLSAGLSGRRGTASTACAFLAFALAFLTGLQYITGDNYGLDALFMNPLTQSQAKTAFPGRMAPNTALCFILLSGGLLAWHGLKKEEGRLNTVMLLAGLVFAFSLTALAGYAFGFEAAYGWWSMSNMSPQTATGLFLESVALAALMLGNQQKSGTIREMVHASWKSALTAVICIAATLAVAQTILNQGQRRTEALARAEAKEVAGIVELGFGNTLTALARMQGRWEKQQGTPPDQWLEDAKNYISDDRSYYSLGLMDREFRVYKMAPEQGRDAFWKDVAPDRPALKRSAANKTAYMKTVPDSRNPGDQMLAVFLPLYKKGSFDGFLMAAYSLDKALDAILKPDTGDFYHYEVVGGGHLLASNEFESGPYNWAIPYESKTDIQGIPVTIRVSFNAASYENGGLVFLVFISGLCVSILLANAVYKAGRLKTSEGRYALTVEGAGAALWDWDISKRRIAWAGQAWKMFGVAHNDEVPRDEDEVRSRFPPEDNEAINKVIFTELEKGDSFTVEFRLRQPDGGYIWAQSRGKVVERRNAQPVRSVGIMTDITELKKAESSSQAYQARLESILENMVDGLITIDEIGHIRSYNKACERIFGYSLAEVVGRNIKMLMPPQYSDNHDQYLQNYRETGMAKIIGIGREVEGRRKDGAVFPIDLSVAEVKLGGQRLFSGIVRDITERKEAEKQLRRSNEELEQFAYIASHDLKAPLRGIDNLAQWIAEDLAGVLTDDAREKMDLLRGRVSRLEMLLEDILQYSRAGRIADNPVEVNTAEMVRQIVEAIEMPQSFKVSVADNMPTLTTPYTPLEQVFLNLISNARKHHDRKTGSIEISAADRGAFYEFTVGDDGPGIPPEFHERVFKMFQTLKPRDDKESSGLGLSIVKKLVEWQGGRVWITSKAGQRGTEFHFLWPRKFTPGERKKDVA